MGLAGPKLEEQGSLQEELVGMGRLAEPVQQTLGGVADEHKLKLFFTLTGEVEEPLANRGGDVGGPFLAHVSDSM